MKRSDNAPEPVGLLGARKLRKDEIKPELAAPMPAPGIDPSKYIIIDAQGRLSTNNPRKVGSDEPGDPAAWQWGEVRCWHTAPLSKG